ncbi:MAG: PHB depolymerase family esterase [Myxococcota bacterium]
MRRFATSLQVGAWLILSAVAGSCGDGGDKAPSSSSASIGCLEGTLDGTIEHVDFEYDGRMRSYELHVPTAYDGSAPLPLVLNFHGFTSSGSGQRAASGMDETADANGFVVAYPNGLSNSWNGGDCCGLAAAEGFDDVGFTRALIDDLGARGCIDLRRVYATGLSNGGFMSHRLACEAADVIAAIAPVAGVLGLESCDPVRPVPVIHFHGTADNIIFYEGGGLVDSISVIDSTDRWLARNGCTDEPVVTFDEGMVTCETASDCDEAVSVTLCTIDGGGHCWPGPPCPDAGTADLPVDLGIGTTDIQANDAMWELFSSVTLPE